jgi:hypothetical protein
MMTKIFLVLLLAKALFSAGCTLQSISKVTTLNHALVVNKEALVLSGHESLEMTNSHYTQNNNIILKDTATLIIRDSFFDHRHDYSFQYRLRAYDNASVVIENSTLRSSDWLNWFFDGHSSLVLRNVTNGQSTIWHVFQGYARATVDRTAKFGATMSDQVEFDIADTATTFIEFVFPPGSSVDEAFPAAMSDYSFPNDGERGIRTKLRIKNSRAWSWGITVNAGTSATIRDTHSLVVTFHLGKPYNNVTAEFSGLLPEHHEDQTWQIRDTRLRLINTKTERWSPIVSGHNTLIVRDSAIADNAFSFDNANVVYDRCVISFLHGNDQVHMRIKDSVVEGDVVATGNSVIELINTRVEGKIVEKNNGRIIVTR